MVGRYILNHNYAYIVPIAGIVVMVSKTIGELLDELPKSENLGTYVAEADRIKAKLTLTADLKRIAVGDTGIDWYVAQVEFYTEPVWQGDKKGFSVTAQYSLNDLNDIFARMKKAEAGVEELLKPVTDHNYNWRERREVMRCIFSLEDQTKHVYQERKEAAKKRRIHVYGPEKKPEVLDWGGH